jgi:carbonic anhydrase
MFLCFKKLWHLYRFERVYFPLFKERALKLITQVRTFSQKTVWTVEALLIVAAFIVGSIVISSSPAFADSAPPHWSYGGDTNPTQWGQISPDFAQCDVGRSQSPINITHTVKGKPAEIAFNYQSAPLVVLNNGHTIQVNYAPGSSVTINGEEFALLQFHFHTPSEHTLKGKAAAMELHLVHRNATGQLAVVGVMMESGAANPLIEQIWQHIPAIGKTNTVKNVSITPAPLLPGSKAYYSYAGSLTTPPCSEGVKWNVMVEPITVSEAQISAFTNLYQVDARPVQATHGRMVELHQK